MKLLALAAGTSFATEAETARKLAADLMAKHNIDSVNAPKDRRVMATARYKPFMPDAMWEFTLVQAVTKLCGCAFYWNGDQTHFDRFTIVGLTPDVEAAGYIMGQLNRQRMQKWLEYKTHGLDGFGKFSFGFARGVEAKINQILRSAPAMAASTNKARLWYETRHDVDKHIVQFGRASSSAGLGAGESASFHRGEMGSPQKRLR